MPWKSLGLVKGWEEKERGDSGTGLWEVVV